MFENVTFYIPSKGRANNQLTLASLSPEVRARCFILVDGDEVWDYEDAGNFNSLPMPDGLTGIGNVRQWAIDNCPTPYLFLLDDDMVFFTREQPGSPKLRKTTGDDINTMFSELIDWMDFDGVPVVGLSARQGNNHVDGDYVEATRQMNFHGVDVARFKELGLVFNGQEVMEDFFMILSLLTKGYTNRVFYKYCWNQIGSGAEGGCSSYRTWELQKLCAEKLRDKFPDFVTVVKKKTTTTWKEFGERYDVRVQWKKAYAFGKSK